MLVNPFSPLINIPTRMPRTPAPSLHSKCLTVPLNHWFEGWISMAHQRLPDHLQAVSEMAVDGRHAPAVWDNFVKSRRTTLFQAIPRVIEAPSIACQWASCDDLLF